MKMDPEVKSLRKEVRELKKMEKLYCDKINELYDRLDSQKNAIWTSFVDYRASKVLTPKMYNLIKLRWGFEGGKTHTLEEAGRQLKMNLKITGGKPKIGDNWAETH